MTFARIAVGSLCVAIYMFASGPGAARAAEPPHRVLMALWRGCEDACRGFQEYIWEKKIPVDFIMRDVSKGNFAETVAEARSLDVDLVVTWGTSATLGIVGPYDHVEPSLHLTDIPVLFMIVTDPVAAKVVPDLEKPGRNVSGTLVVVPEDVQMQAIQSYMPFDRIGVAYNADEINAVKSVERLKAIAADQGFAVVAREIPVDASGKPVAESLPDVVADLAKEEVDLIYIGSSSFILVNRDIFTKAALDHGIPVAAAGEVPVVESSALMGLVSRYHTVGQLTAKRAEEILVDGANVAEIPVKALSRFSLIVNMAVAHKLNLYPPLSLVNILEVIKWEKK